MSQGQTQKFATRILPPSWIEETDPRLDPGLTGYINTITGLAAITSQRRERDGKMWAHISISHYDRIPTWKEVREAKDLFMGSGVRAIQVLPPAAEYVNIHPHCLHLWACLDGDPIPDFRDHEGMI